MNVFVSRSFFLNPAQRSPGRFDSDGRFCATRHAPVFVLTTMQVQEVEDVREGEGHVSVAVFSCVQSTQYPCDEDPSHGEFGTSDAPTRSKKHSCVCMYDSQFDR